MHSKQDIYIDSCTGTWVVCGKNTGVKAKGGNGQSGVTPHMDRQTKTWWIGTTDTGEAYKGYKGDKGDLGESFYEWATARLTDQNGDGQVNQADIVKFLTGPKGDKGDDFGAWIKVKMLDAGYDINGDGNLSDAEIQQGLAKWLGVEMGPVTRVFVDALETITDKNNDGKVDLDELREAMYLWLAGDSAEITLFHTLLASIKDNGGDTNSDGTIDEAELKVAFSTWLGVSADSPEVTLFHTLLESIKANGGDTDNDGVISEAELKAALVIWLGVTPQMAQLFYTANSAVPTGPNGTFTYGDIKTALGIPRAHNEGRYMYFRTWEDEVTGNPIPVLKFTATDMDDVDIPVIGAYVDSVDKTADFNAGNITLTAGQRLSVDFGENKLVKKSYLTLGSGSAPRYWSTGLSGTTTRYDSTVMGEARRSGVFFASGEMNMAFFNYASIAEQSVSDVAAGVIAATMAVDYGSRPAVEIMNARFDGFKDGSGIKAGYTGSISNSYWESTASGNSFDVKTITRDGGGDFSMVIMDVEWSGTGNINESLEVYFENGGGGFAKIPLYSDSANITGRDVFMAVIGDGRLHKGRAGGAPYNGPLTVRVKSIVDSSIKIHAYGVKYV